MRVYGVTGWKNSGKTTLVERLVAEITGRGLAVSTLKHAHHAFDVDRPGKDSYRHRAAGARQVLVASSRRWALMSELRGAPEPPLAELLARLDPVDLVLVEGWKRDRHPKIEARRAAAAQEPDRRRATPPSRRSPRTRRCRASRCRSSISTTCPASPTSSSPARGSR